MGTADREDLQPAVRPRSPHAAVGSSRSRRAARSCRGGSPFAEVLEGIVDMLGQVGLPALEQWQRRFGRLVATRDQLDALADQLGLALSAEPGSPLQATLLRFRQVHRGSLHAIYSTIRHAEPLIAGQRAKRG